MRGLLACASLAAATIAHADIAGTRPAYTRHVLSQPPNAGAIRARRWAPEIDLGYAPQGVTVAGESVLLSAYNGAGGAVVRSLSLRFPLRASFITWHGRSLWIGEYAKPERGRILRFALARMDAAPPGAEPREEQAYARLAIATRSQGASFDKDGYLWLSQSSSQFGTLQKVDPASGKVLASYPMVAGIEDLGFDADGMLWAVSEAGSKRWRNWPTFYPILFSIDVRSLSSSTAP